jgi:hypothetical protein
MKSYLEYIPMVLLSSFTLKLLFTNNWSYENGIVFLGLVAISAVFFLKIKNEEINSLKKQLDDHSAQLDDLKKQNEHIKTSISGMKMAQNIKSVPRF